jgi:hypothetical protein
MLTHRHMRRLLGQRVQCHTIFGTIHGVIVRCNKHYVILGSGSDPERDGTMEIRSYPMGPMGGPGLPPGGGGGWQVAIPLAAILGITAIGLHWW